MKTLREISVTSKRLTIREDSPLYHIQGKRIRSPNAAADMVRRVLPSLTEAEYFVAIPTNAYKQPIGVEVVHKGAIDSCPVDPRSILRASVKLNACGLIIAHNHPSGDTTPSSDDLALTRRLKKGCEYLGIVLLDHLIVCEEEFYSMSEWGEF